MKRAALFAIVMLVLPCSVLAEDVSELITKGQKLVQRGKLQAAFDTFKEAIAKDPRNGTAASALAQVATFMNRPEEAVFYYAAYLYLEADYLGDAEEVRKAKAKQERAVYKAATLKVKADPPDAEIQVNGIPMAKGELTLVGTADREYVVTATLTDFNPFKLTVTMGSGEERSVQARLTKIIYSGNVNLKILPKDEVKIFVDTKYVGKSMNQVETVEGKRLLCFKKEGFDRWWRYVTVPRNASVDLEVTLREQSRPDESCEVWPEED